MNTNTASELSLRKAMVLQKINEEYSNTKFIDSIDRLFTEGTRTLELSYNNLCKTISLAEMEYYTKNGELLSEATGAEAKGVITKIIEAFRKWFRQAMDFFVKLYRTAKLKLIEIFHKRSDFLEKYKGILSSAKGTVTLDKGYDFKYEFDINIISKDIIKSLVLKADENDNITMAKIKRYILSIICYGDENHVDKSNDMNEESYIHDAVYGKEITNYKASVRDAYGYTIAFLKSLKVYDQVCKDAEMKLNSQYKSIEDEYKASTNALNVIANNSEKYAEAVHNIEILKNTIVVYKMVMNCTTKVLNTLFRSLHDYLRQCDAVMHLYITDYYAQNRNESAFYNKEDCNMNTASTELPLKEAMQLQQMNEEYSHIKPASDVNRLFTEGMYTLELCYNNFCKSVSLAEMKYYVKNGELLSEATSAEAKSIKDKIIKGFKEWVKKAIDFFVKMYRTVRLKLVEMFNNKKEFLAKYESIFKSAKSDTVTLDTGYNFIDVLTSNHTISDEFIADEVIHVMEDSDYKRKDVENKILSILCYGDDKHIKPDDLTDTQFMLNAVYGKEISNYKISVSEAYKYVHDYKDTLNKYDRISLTTKSYLDKMYKTIDQSYEKSLNTYAKTINNYGLHSTESDNANLDVNMFRCMIIVYEVYISYNNTLSRIKSAALNDKLRQCTAALQLYIQNYTQKKNESATVIETAVKNNFSGLSIEDIFARVSTL